jgi:hypothetical protein
VLEVAALQEFTDHHADDWPPEAIALLVALFIDRLELRIEALNQSIEGRLLWMAGAIGTANLLAEARYSRCPTAATPQTTAPQQSRSGWPRPLTLASESSVGFHPTPVQILSGRGSGRFLQSGLKLVSLEHRFGQDIRIGAEQGENPVGTRFGR